MSGAERQRRLRERRKAGRMALQIECGESWPETLCQLGLLRPCQIEDPAAIGAATTRYLATVELADVDVTPSRHRL